MVIFDLDAEGMTSLECVNYIPREMDVIGNLEAAKVAIDRFNATIIFNGNEYTEFWQLYDSVTSVLLRNEA